MTACPTLVTERLILRPLEETDLDSCTEMFKEPAVRDALHLPADFSRRNAWAGMAQWRGQWELRGSGHWALEERSSGRFVGQGGLHRPESHDWPGLEVGWTLHPLHWGRGYATEAGAGSIAYAFEVIGVDEVFSVILPENLRSQAVARRLGLTLIEERVLSSFPDAPQSGASGATSGIRRHTVARVTGRADGSEHGRPPAEGHRRWRPPSTRTTSPVT